MLEPEKSIYGIIGSPVSHSLSPLMHNAAFKKLHLNAIYQLMPIKEEELEPFFKDLHEEDCPIAGLNVTIPYKDKVIPYLDGLAPFAQSVKAVNTIVITPDRKLQGLNTDGPGFLAHLTELGFQLGGKRVSILGVGGSSRAILAVMCLLPQRPAAINVYARDIEKADLLLNELRENRIDVSLVSTTSDIEDLNIELADLLINTTPVGLKPEDPSLISEEALHSNLLVYDLIYNPKETRLLALAKKKGARCSNGLGMLYYQGVLALQHWINLELPVEVKEVMRKSLLKAL